MIYYIYTLKHPITNEVRYVGKTINIQRRYKQHLYDKRHSHKASWIKSLKAENLKPILTVIEECTEENWIEREKYWISQYDNLTNLREGGGADFKRTTSEETKEKIRQKNLGKITSEETKNKLRLNSTAIKISVYGITFNSIKQASIILKISDFTVNKRVKSDKYPNYIFL